MGLMNMEYNREVIVRNCENGEQHHFVVHGYGIAECLREALSIQEDESMKQPHRNRLSIGIDISDVIAGLDVFAKLLRELAADRGSISK
jgi:hypothetical protein